MFEMEVPGHLVKGSFALQMDLRLRLLENRDVDPELAAGKNLENLIPYVLRIFGCVEAAI